MRRPSPAREAVAGGTSPAHASPAQSSTADRQPSLAGWRLRLPARLVATTQSRLALAWLARSRLLDSRILGVRALGALAVALAGYCAFAYPRSSSGGESAVIVGTATVVALVTVGLNMQASEERSRMGRLLVYSGVIFSLMLLLGSNNSLAFSVGWLGAAVLPPLTAYLFLAYPAGRLHSHNDRWLLIAAGVPLAVCWTVAVFASAQPPFATPLLRCAPQCPPNALFLGFSTGADSVLWDIIRASWLALAWGVAASLSKRTRTASAPVGLSVAPVLLLSVVYALATTGALLVGGQMGSVEVSFRSAFLAVAPAIPLAMLLGLTRESLFMGSALSSFVTRLGEEPSPDLQLLMAETLHDPSLRILYRRPTVDAYVDSAGAPVAEPVASAQLGVTSIERDGRPVAVVVHEVELSDQKRFIEAAGAAGVIWFRNAQLAADLKASIADLEASRTRIVETADAERQRIEHSLHDGAQQHLVGMRLRLEMAAELMSRDHERGVGMLAEIAAQMDEALEDVRNLAKGVYPPLLPEHGLGEAIRSANRRSPWPASLDVGGIGRYASDTESAVYFCCLEALQNITKHAGPAVGGAIHLWEDGERLHFEVSDEGVGFAQDAVEPGEGLINMRDRMEAAGGSVSVWSRPRRGTAVRGCVPITTRVSTPLTSP
ncbi:MAG TPA: histidine kinase [Solirubrobacteraceae bacterium]|nr:histidine kinase [Solirubrobacteraceae bacterium]